MILDHELLTVAGLVEHSPGIVSSVVGVALYALLRDGLPAFNSYRRRRNGNPGHNPGTHIAERMLACEEAIGEVKKSCTRTETLWEGQKEFNKRMEKHIENFYKRFEK